MFISSFASVISALVDCPPYAPSVVFASASLSASFCFCNSQSFLVLTMLVSLFCGGFLAEGRLVGGSPSSVTRIMRAAGIDFLSVLDIIGRCETSSVARTVGAAEIDDKFLL
jgi:hypothetical protein